MGVAPAAAAGMPVSPTAPKAYHATATTAPQQTTAGLPALPVMPVVPTATKAYYAAPPLNVPAKTQHTIAVQQEQVVPHHNSLHQRFPTISSTSMELALEVSALNALDYSERIICSDISTLDCESVKVEAHYNPAVEETPFVPPLEISIPVNLEHLALQQQQHEQQHYQQSKAATTRRASFSSSTGILRPSDLTRQTSCQSRLEMSQASPSYHPRSKSLFVSSSHNKAMMKLAMNNGGALPPEYSHHHHIAADSHDEQDVHDDDIDPSLEDYANGAGAVTWGGDDNHSRQSYYTSPTDLYTSDDSDPVIIVPTTNMPMTKKGMVKRELKKIICRFKQTTKSSKAKTKTLQPQHEVEGAIKDYDSFGSERGFC